MPSQMMHTSTQTDNHRGLSLQSTQVMNNRTRKSNRLRTYDYSRGGHYFVTICTHNRVNYFGEIDRDQMELSNIGQIAKDCWQHIPEHFENTALDEFVVMPNHIHGIIILVGDADLRPLHQQTTDRSGMYLSKIIHGFKSSSVETSRDVGKIRSLHGNDPSTTTSSGPMNHWMTSVPTSTTTRPTGLRTKKTQPTKQHKYHLKSITYMEL